MRYRDAAAFRQALEQRLRARAAGDAARLARDRKRVAFDRLLARLNDALPSDPVSEHDTLMTPDLLSFAGIDPIEVPAVPLERHIAEKLHAYTRRYRDDQPSSRAKDLIDIILMSELASFEFDQLRKVIVRVFETRATHELPASVPAPPREWAVPYRALAEEVGVDPDLSVGHGLAAAFLDPILAAEPGINHWDANNSDGRVDGPP